MDAPRLVASREKVACSARTRTRRTCYIFPVPRDHAVQPGECFSAIAVRYGFAPLTLWELPENAALRELRTSMYQLVGGEDTIHIPDLRPRRVSAATGKRHRFRRLSVPEVLRVRLLDPLGAPRAGLAYKLEVGDRAYEGKTTDDGVVEHYVANEELRGTLTVYAANAVEIYQLRIGKLLPVSDPRGVQQRLRNLGYYSGHITGSLKGASAAIAAFQRASGLEATGTLDDGTRSALDRAFGGS